MVNRRCTSDSLWSKCIGGPRRPDLDLYHLYSCGEKVVGDDLMPPVGAPLEVPGENRVCLEQRIEGSRQGVDVDRTLDVCAETHEIVCLSEHFLAARQLPNDRRWKHFQTP